MDSFSLQSTPFLKNKTMHLFPFWNCAFISFSRLSDQGRRAKWNFPVAALKYQVTFLIFVLLLYRDHHQLKLLSQDMLLLVVGTKDEKNSKQQEVSKSWKLISLACSTTFHC